MATLNEDMNTWLDFCGRWQSEKALVLLAHVMVMNLCQRRETLPETLHDVDQVFEQIKQLVKWNYANLRDADDTSVYYFNDPALTKAKMQ